MEPIGFVLLVGVYGTLLFRQIRGRGPPAWATLLAGGVLFVVLGALPLTTAWAAVESSLPVIAFLFALFLFASALERSGALAHVARWTVARARHPAAVPALVYLGFGVLSSVIVNDALAVVGVPLLVLVARRLAIPARPLLLSLAFGVTVGSMATPVGNPQNLLVALGGGLASPFLTFLRYLLLPAVACLIAGAIYLRWAFRGLTPSTPSPSPPIVLVPRTGWSERLRRHPVLAIFAATLAGLLALELLSGLGVEPTVPAYIVALGGAAALLVLTPNRGELLRGPNWTLLILFLGLFLVIAGASATGVVQSIEVLAPIPTSVGSGTGALAAVTLGALVGSQLFSNVPWVALQLPLLRGLGYSTGQPVVWVALASMSTLAGNLTLLGAASNLIVVEQAQREGERISLTEFLSLGVPLTLLTVSITFLALYAGL